MHGAGARGTRGGRRWTVGGLVVGVAALLACSDGVGPGACDGTGRVALPGGSCLVFEDGGALGAHRARIEAGVASAVTAVRPRVPVDGVAVRVVAGGALVIPEVGIGGRAVAGETVRLAFDPGSPVLDASLSTGLLPLLAHELHHIARQRTVGYGADLLGALVSEGLADHFAVEVAGGDPPAWSVALAEDELERWTAEAESHWFDAPYDHAAWFLGADPAIPRWTGYAVGWSLVRAYLEAHPDRSPAELHDETARVVAGR